MASIFEHFTDIFKSVDKQTLKDAVLVSGTAVNILDAVGGADNIVAFKNCATRLRLTLKDTSVVNVAECMKAGAIGVVFPEDEENAVHVVLGTAKAQSVGDAFEQLLS